MKKRINWGGDSIFWLLYLSYTILYLARLNLSLAGPELQRAGVLNAAQFGLLGSVFSVVYSCGRLFNGRLGDRLAPKLLIVSGLFLAGFSNLFMTILPPYLLLLSLWCLNAFGQSMLWSAMLRSVTALYGKDRADKKTPILVTSVSVGNIVAIPVTSFLVNNFGMRAAFLVPGCMSVLCALAVLWILPTPAEGGHTPQFLWKDLLTDRQVRRILLPAMFHGAMKDNIPLWMAVFFVDRFGIHLENAIWYVLLIPVVGLAGRLCYPVCYRLAKGREGRITRICFLGCSVFGGALCMGKIGPWTAAACLSLIYALVSMINTGFLSMFPLRFADRGWVSSVSGIADFTTYLGAGVASAAYGLAIDKSPSGYLIMFGSWMVLSFLAVLLMLPNKQIKTA